ncbi:hypothetical protein GDO81_015950 [Engystomops pustulosus]|uniref:Uncharacterized protein n=1 Tax=Engystomops pustulosus TaxID=76066 RepID=A0AAV7APH1_ENGPU|nr:hypothetical protein GDO81_015950 [Engystomops pustulosus]
MIKFCLPAASTRLWHVVLLDMLYNCIQTARFSAFYSVKAKNLKLYIRKMKHSKSTQSLHRISHYLLPLSYVLGLIIILVLSTLH